MSILNLLNRILILPGSDLILGYNITKHFNFLQKSQWWDRNRLRNFQNTRLKELITHSYKYVPFYRELFNIYGLKPSDFKDVGDLKKLPVIQKPELKKNYPHKIISTYFKKNDLIYSSSSGSTGYPFQYYYNKDSYCMNMACLLRGWEWMGYRLGDKYVKISQNPRGNLTKKMQDFFNRSLYLFAKDVSELELLNVLNKIKKYQPEFVRCYPDPLYFLVKYARKRGINGVKLKGINTTGNILFPEARKIIESFFKCRITDAFSCEGGANVTECSTGESYHSAMEYAYTEVLDEHGHEVKLGQRGRLVTTDLWNLATPFIRYDTQDIVVKSEKECSCGRKLLSIDRIEGRDSDILVTPDGKIVIVHIFTIFFEWIKSVDQFQAIQNDYDDFLIKIVVNEMFTKDIYNEIFSYWQKYFGKRVNLKVQVVDSIENAFSGKRKFLIRSDKVNLPI